MPTIRQKIEIATSKQINGYIAEYLFKRIRTNFILKSNGGNDEFGDSWKPLKPATIAARPITESDARRFNIDKANLEKGLLTPAQKQQWGAIFRSSFLRLAADMDEKKAKVEAAKIAWSIMKKRGAMTKIGTLGKRKVKMLRVSNRLLESLTPGRPSKRGYTPRNADQIYREDENSIVIGTSVGYASRQHKMRRLYPSARRMGPWLREAVKYAIQKCL